MYCCRNYHTRRSVDCWIRRGQQVNPCHEFPAGRTHTQTLLIIRVLFIDANRILSYLIRITALSYLCFHYKYNPRFIEMPTGLYFPFVVVVVVVVVVVG